MQNQLTELDLELAKASWARRRHQELDWQRYPGAYAVYRTNEMDALIAAIELIGRGVQ